MLLSADGKRQRLLFDRSANGADGSAGAAADAGTGVDLVMISTLGNSANGAAGQLAVYDAQGDIVGSEVEGVISSGQQILGPKVVDDLDRRCNDENVKAVVPVSYTHLTLPTM